MSFVPCTLCSSSSPWLYPTCCIPKRCIVAIWQNPWSIAFVVVGVVADQKDPQNGFHCFPGRVGFSVGSPEVLE